MTIIGSTSVSSLPIEVTVSQVIAVGLTTWTVARPIAYQESG